MNTQAKAIHSHTSFPVPAMTVGIETLRVGASFATMIAIVAIAICCLIVAFRIGSKRR